MKNRGNNSSKTSEVSLFDEAMDARERTFAAYLVNQRPDRICFIESFGDMLQFVLTDATNIWVSTSLAQIYQLLPNDKFFFCGATYIVNVDHIYEFWVSNQAMLVMTCGNVLPVPITDVYQLKDLLSKRFNRTFPNGHKPNGSKHIVPQMRNLA